MNVTISLPIKEVCPQLKLAILSCDVINTPGSEDFWHEMDAECKTIRESFTLEAINKRPQIAATRTVYKALGKDPNRYRPSAEALCRRIVRDIPVYRVSMLVDIINLVSVRSGFSIGGFDADAICGNIELGVGAAGEPFDAIGRGLLNIEGLPVFRDTVGGIGTPTSDNERTKLSDGTTRLLMIINGYAGVDGLSDAVAHAESLLKRYAGMKNMECTII